MNKFFFFLAYSSVNVSTFYYLTLHISTRYIRTNKSHEFYCKGLQLRKLCKSNYTLKKLLIVIMTMLCTILTKLLVCSGRGVRGERGSLQGGGYCCLLTTADLLLLPFHKLWVNFELFIDKPRHANVGNETIKVNPHCTPFLIVDTVLTFIFLHWQPQIQSYKVKCHFTWNFYLYLLTILDLCAIFGQVFEKKRLRWWPQTRRRI